MKVNKNVIPDFVNVFSADNECSPNPCVGPFQRIKMSFFLLSIFVDELISTSKIITYVPFPPLGCEKIHVYHIQFNNQDICIC